MHKIKTTLAIFLLILLFLLTVQNMGRVELTFLIWTFEIRRFVVIVFCFITGFAVGWVVKAILGKFNE